MRTIKRRKPATAGAVSHSSRRLLRNVPDYVLETWPIDERGLAEGLELIGMHWQRQVATGRLPLAELEAAILPLAALTAALLQALLRGTPIDERAQLFADLVEDADGLLAGEPSRVVLRAGIA